MITHSGVHVIPDSKGVPNERDIAVAMCRITRYAGALWCPLAAHSIMVAEFAAMATSQDIVWSHALLHDAHECVTGEVTRWWKPSAMKNGERDLDVRILRYFGLEPYRHAELATAIKEADEKSLCAESTILELPGWKDFYRQQSGHDIPVVSESERAIAEQILNGLWRRTEMIDEDSRQVGVLQQALQKVRLGRHRDARKMLSPVCFVEDDH